MNSPTIDTRLTFGQRELRVFDSSRVDPKGRTYIDPGFTGINIIPSGPMLYIISQLTEKDLSNVTQVSHRFNRLTERHRKYLYAGEDFGTLLIKIISSATDIGGIRWLTKYHPGRKCPSRVLDWASANGHLEIVRLLLEAQKPCTIRALGWASLNGHAEIVKLLLAANKSCTTEALDYASDGGHIEVVKLLLKAGSPYSDCTTLAFNCALLYGYTKIIKLLLAANKPCATDALDWASLYGHIEIVKLLLAAGSPYSDCTYRALDWASVNGHTEIVKLLLAADKPCSE